MKGSLPSARTFHKAAVVSKQMYIVGGFDGEKLNDVWKVNLDKICYQQSPSRPEKGVNLKEFEQSKNAFFRPSTSPSQPQQSTAKVQKSTALWKKLTDNNTAGNPEERTGHAVALLDDILYIIGGVNSKNACLPMNFVETYSLQTHEWSRKHCSGEAPTTRSSIQNVALDKQGTQFFFGGYFVEEFYNDAYCFSLRRLHWTKVAGNLDRVSRRAYFSLDKVGDELYIYGGRGKTDIFEDLIKVVYDPASNTATCEKVVAIGDKPTERFGHASTVIGRSIFMFGGWDGKACLNDLLEFSTHSKIWYNISVNAFGQKPSPRYRLEASALNDKMYLFGGVNDHQKKFNTLLEYDPAVKEWAVVEGAGDIPSARSFLRLVSRSQSILLFGGIDDKKRGDLFEVSIAIDGSTPLRRRSEALREDSPGVRQQSLLTGSKPNSKSLFLYYKLLNEQVAELSKKFRDEKATRLCKVCRSQEIDSMYLECCHCVACYGCAVKETIVSRV